MFLYLNYPSFLHPEIIPGIPFLRWYALMYLVAFGVAYWLFSKQVKNSELHFKSGVVFTEDDQSSFFMAGILGLVLGARIASCLIYDDTLFYLTHPWLIFWPFDSDMHFTGWAGMSYHGGFIGGLLGIIIWCRVTKHEMLPLLDTIAASIPLGYTFGRWGNFCNGELYGRITTSPIGMIFPQAPASDRFSAAEPWVAAFAQKCGIDIPAGAQLVNLPRHPSQLYEAFFEGIILWLIIWALRKKKPFNGFLAVMYTFGYGFFRFFLEYFRQPDANIGYRFSPNSTEIFRFTSVLNISTGQILCLLMMLGSILWYIVLKIKYKREQAPCTGK